MGRGSLPGTRECCPIQSRYFYRDKKIYTYTLYIVYIYVFFISLVSFEHDPFQRMIIGFRLAFISNLQGMPNSFTKAHCDEERNGACDASSVWWKDITSAAKFHWIASLVVRVIESYVPHPHLERLFLGKSVMMFYLRHLQTLGTKNDEDAFSSSRSHVKPTDVKFISNLRPIYFKNSVEGKCRKEKKTYHEQSLVEFPQESCHKA